MEQSNSSLSAWSSMSIDDSSGVNVVLSRPIFPVPLSLCPSFCSPCSFLSVDLSVEANPVDRPRKSKIFPTFSLSSKTTTTTTKPKHKPQSQPCSTSSATFHAPNLNKSKSKDKDEDEDKSNPIHHPNPQMLLRTTQSWDSASTNNSRLFLPILSILLQTITTAEFHAFQPFQPFQPFHQDHSFRHKSQRLSTHHSYMRIE